MGANRIYENNDIRIEFKGLSKNLFFGFKNEGGINYADPEKAILDTLFFYLRGNRYSFDIYSDIDISSIDTIKLKRYLKKYKNPKFKSFVKKYFNGKI